MFRLFLRKKLLSGADSRARANANKTGAAQRGAGPSGAGPSGPGAPPRRNRRVFARHNIDHKHLTLMNDADILLVREISPQGFSTEVSKRGYERLVVGDVYDARMRYLGEIYDLQARVAWKANAFIGFELVKTGRATSLFIRRLLKPIEIASSLSQVDASFMQEQKNGKTWYHGDNDSDLYVWHDVETNELRAWQLAIGETFVEWNDTSGLASGALAPAPGHDAVAAAKVHELVSKRDSVLDSQKKQFAIDVIMALQHPVREELLETFAATA